MQIEKFRAYLQKFQAFATLLTSELLGNHPVSLRLAPVRREVRIGEYAQAR